MTSAAGSVQIQHESPWLALAGLLLAVALVVAFAVALAARRYGDRGSRARLCLVIAVSGLVLAGTTAAVARTVNQTVAANRSAATTALAEHYPLVVVKRGPVDADGSSFAEATRSSNRGHDRRCRS